MTLTKSGRLRDEERCAVVYNGKVRMVGCSDKNDDSDRKWDFLENGSIVHKKSGLCLDAEGLKHDENVKVKMCDLVSYSQKWIFENLCLYEQNIHI